MLDNIIGREIKIVGMNNVRLDENNNPMLYVDMLVYNNMNHVFEVIDYDKENNIIAINIKGQQKVWLYRNEYIFLIRNLIQ